MTVKMSLLEVKKELDMPKTSPKEIIEFIFDPLRRGENGIIQSINLIYCSLLIHFI
jgi:hypothetical protein